MKYLRLDSVGGAAGDMILAALTGLGADLKLIEKTLQDAVDEDQFVIETTPFSDSGLNGLKLNVRITHASGKERGLHEIEEIIDRSAMPEAAKELAHKVFHHLAHAEAAVHGCHHHHIHFHEVGAVDSIVDILGSCFAFVQLGIDAVTFGVLPEGTGTFCCRHGIYPIPAPATMNLLKGIRIEQTDEPFEMITPTGAALLTSFPGGQGLTLNGTVLCNANSFGSRKLNGRPNVLRASLLESTEENKPLWQLENCIELESNLDDISAETAGVIAAELFRKGALDVWMIPCVMKKQRPGFVFHVLCKMEDSKRFTEYLFRESGTLGIRIREIQRQVLKRDFTEAEVCGKKIRIKNSYLGDEQLSSKPESDDCASVAAETGLTYHEIQQLAIQAVQKK